MFSFTAFLFRYWRETLIGLGFIVSGIFVIDYLHGKKEIVQLEQKLDVEREHSKSLQLTLDDLAVKTKEQKDRVDAAEAERAKVIKRLAADINSMKNQRPPKDCSAIDWSIKNKGDLSWPQPTSESSH